MRECNNCIFQGKFKELILLPIKTVKGDFQVIPEYFLGRGMVNYMPRLFYKHYISLNETVSISEDNSKITISFSQENNRLACD